MGTTDCDKKRVVVSAINLFVRQIRGAWQVKGASPFALHGAYECFASVQPLSVEIAAFRPFFANFAVHFGSADFYNSGL